MAITLLYINFDNNFAKINPSIVSYRCGGGGGGTLKNA